MPPAGEVVTQNVLVSGQNTSLSLARGFAGTANPTTIWQRMIDDAQDAFLYYRELEEKDDEVGGALDQLKLSVLRRERQVTPKDDSAEAARTAQFIQEQLARVPAFHEVLEALLDAPAYGVAIAEMIFDVSAGQVSLLDIKDRPQELFCFGKRHEPQIGPLRFLKDRAALEGEEVPEQKFLVFSYRPRSGNRRGRPLLRSVFWPSWFKRQTLRFWLRFGEKGPGIAAVLYPSGATADEQTKALAAAESIVEKIAVALPENFQFVKELLTSARSQNPAVYEKLVDRMAMAITRRILGQTLTSHGSEQGAGSLALGQVHGDTKEERIDEVARKVETVINDQLVRPLVFWNFGPNAPMPRWSILKKDVEDLSARSAVDERLQRMGMPIAQTYIEKKYGMPQVQDDDLVLQPRASAAPGIFAPGGGEFAERRPAEVAKNLADLRKLMAQLKDESLDAFRGRVEVLAQEARINAGGAL